MDAHIERLLLAARWLLLPLYVALLAAVLAIYVPVWRELYHLFSVAGTADETELPLILLSILDFVLVANLLVMVGVSSYESYISKIAVSAGDDKPEWLGKLDSSNVKVKVVLAIVLISAIHLLRAFMREGTSTEQLAVLAAVHLVFVISAVMVAWVDRLGRDQH
jgi:uncharacterized protein (TIGR00645 family)